jgi:hypothetical protein
MYDIVIATMNSNEIDINEWIIHNLLIGFQHIFIYDDGSNPPINITIDLLDIKYKNCVTIYRLDSHYEYNKAIYKKEETLNLLYFDEDIYNKHKSNKQRYLMNYFLKSHKNISKYCFFCDIDEFIYLRDDDNINNYLSKMSSYDIINIPWLYYGTSFYIDKPKGLLIDNFRCHAKKYDVGKCIVNMSKIDEITCIHTITNNKKLSIMVYDRNAPLFTIPIHINHYITKSYKSVLKKKKEHCLGQTNDFYRSVAHILGFGIGAGGLNEITNNNIMKKYVGKINEILNYELNDQHIDFSNYSKGLVQLNGDLLTFEYIIKNASIELIETIIKSNNIRYLKNDEVSL